ncbi:beta-1,4-endo-glucanase [Paenibacillus algicola]|uniref:Endoglucanase n=1 Tax=Paenibacillus algicola TaxID=2565926 RepID=A0A4P8XLX2_9BACL|nr:glycoside hydrolase family 9 protein [Paenibacillus algicola]QCT02660.1 beta-1,4-endo-glucanase [Paenibacillus algicola]
MSKVKSRGILVNQIGYAAHHVKGLLLTGTEPTFHIYNEMTEELVYSGEAEGPVQDDDSGSVVFQGDFTELQTPGRYYAVASGMERSASFIIEEKPYEELQQGLLKAFYYFRCGTELEEEFAGPWGHAACHTEPGVIYDQASQKLDGNGGWHDAGDYGKYVVPGAKAVADLLLAFELYPAAFTAALPLPESDRIMPDVLHECKVELEWLFKMQNQESGGSYHKLTTRSFPDLHVMPEEDEGELVFSPISATATACHTAVMALAARLYQPYDATFAIECLRSSLNSYRWLDNHPQAPGFTNPEGITTGEYGDDQDVDERFWAAAELYRTTGDEMYHKQLRKLAEEEFSKTELGWADMGGYGTFSYLLNGEGGSDPQVYALLKQQVLAEADRLLKVASHNGYQIAMEEQDYIWGSNMVLLNRAMFVLLACELEPDLRYIELADSHLHYLLGRNVLDVCYVTGFGDRPILYPHHRPSAADAVIEPVPGLVSGGPNRHLNDECLKEQVSGQPAAACFIDHEASYAGNEVTIYWNSPAVFVTAGMNR